MNNIVSTTEELYATMPMSVIQVQTTAFAQSDDEEVYTAFEQAISDRCIAFRSYLTRPSGLVLAPSPRRQTEPIVHNAFPTRVMAMKETSNSYKATTIHEQVKQLRQMLIISFALICILVGFDLMGLLWLYIR